MLSSLRKMMNPQKIATPTLFPHSDEDKHNSATVTDFYNIDRFIATINTVMVRFSKTGAFQQYNEHVQSVAVLERDLRNNQLEENMLYFIGRYDIYEDQKTLSQHHKLIFTEQAWLEMFANVIREKLSLPKEAMVNIKRSRISSFVQVSLPADSIKMYFAQNAKPAVVAQASVQQPDLQVTRQPGLLLSRS